MTHQEDIAKAYYNVESSVYSTKRYIGKITSYVRYLFTRREALLMQMLSDILSGNQSPVSLLEVGCADGVLLRTAVNRFPDSFTRLVGVDIAPEMVVEGRKRTSSPKITYEVRDGNKEWESHIDPPFDLMIEIGFVTSQILKTGEVELVKRLVKPGGLYIVSLASRKSWHAKLKLKNASYLSDYALYKEYEAMLKSIGTIISYKSYGLFIPKLWAFPVLGRLLQKPIDVMATLFFRDAYHERLYLVRVSSTGKNQD